MNLQIVKAIQLADNCFQTILNGRIYVGHLDFIRSILVNEVPLGYQLEIIPLAGVNSPHHNCLHDWINVGFTHNKYVCRICDCEDPLQNQR